MRAHVGWLHGTFLAGVFGSLLLQADSDARPTGVRADPLPLQPTPVLESGPTPPADSTGFMTGGRRLALLIGIGDYLWFETIGYPPKVDLKGPPHDLERMRHTLRRFGFEGEDNVRILEDEDASKDGIAGGFRWLIDQVADTSDVVVIYYSGHGSRAPDIDGDEALVTVGDVTDEALVPWDADDPTDPAKLVIDDDIRGWLAELGTRNVTVIIDACFSGTTTREGRPGAARWRARGPEGGSGAGAGVEGLQDLDHTLITAASPNQTAKEDVLADGRTYGLFTYHLTRALDGASSTTRYDELMRQVSGQLSQREQTPQLEGDRGARLFRVHGDLPRRQYVKLNAIDAGRYEIDAGAVHGVRTSALYDVYAPEEVEFEVEPLGQFRADSVTELTSYGQMVNGQNNPPANARGVLARVPSGARRVTSLQVFVHPDAAGVSEAVDSIPFTGLADSLQADAWVVRDGEVYRVFVEGLEIPPRLADSSYTAAGLLPDSHGYRGSSAALCRGLYRALSIKTFRAIENPEPPSDLEVQVQLVEVGSEPRERPMYADTAVIRDSVRSYDVYAKVEAPNASALYFTAVVVGHISKPFTLYPDRGLSANQPFPLNEWVRVTRDSFEAHPPDGLEVISAVASSDQFDFRSITDRLDVACTSSRGREEDESREAAAVTGWKSIHRPIVFVDERSR